MRTRPAQCGEYCEEGGIEVINAVIVAVCFGALTLIGGVINLSAALSVLLGRALPSKRPRFTTWIVAALFIVGIATAVDAGNDVWMFWAIQIPLVSTFLLSGAFAAPACAGEHEARSERVGGPAFFVAVTWLLAITPLVVEEAWPHYRTHWRATGSPTLAILQFVGWSFGGPMPDCVVPETDVGFERGVGFPPRYVTVPMSTILIAAWTSIVFSASTLGLRRIRNERRRITALFAFAPLLGTVVLIMNPRVGLFDPGLFRPDADDRSAVWQSDPYTMRTFGLVVLGGLLCSAGLLVAIACARRSHSEVVPSGSSG